MFPLAFGFGGPVDLAIIGGIVLLLFGTSKLKDFGKGAGEGIKEFKKAVHEDEHPAESVREAQNEKKSDDGEPKLTAG